MMYTLNKTNGGRKDFLSLIKMPKRLYIGETTKKQKILNECIIVAWTQA